MTKLIHPDYEIVCWKYYENEAVLSMITYTCIGNVQVKYTYIDNWNCSPLLYTFLTFLVNFITCLSSGHWALWAVDTDTWSKQCFMVISSLVTNSICWQTFSLQCTKQTCALNAKLVQNLYYRVCQKKERHFKYIC